MGTKNKKIKRSGKSFYEHTIFYFKLCPQQEHLLHIITERENRYI